MFGSGCVVFRNVSDYRLCFELDNDGNNDRKQGQAKTAFGLDGVPGDEQGERAQ